MSNLKSFIHSTNKHLLEINSVSTPETCSEDADKNRMGKCSCGAHAPDTLHIVIDEVAILKTQGEQHKEWINR